MKRLDGEKRLYFRQDANTKFFAFVAVILEPDRFEHWEIILEDALECYPPTPLICVGCDGFVSLDLHSSKKWDLFEGGLEHVRRRIVLNHPRYLVVHTELLTRENELERPIGDNLIRGQGQELYVRL